MIKERTIRLQTRTPIAVTTIITINVVVFLLWKTSTPSLGFLHQNFLVSWAALVDGRFWTLLTSVFSHNMLFHIFINMFVLFSFGPALEAYLGTRRFVRFYLVAGLVASLSHSVVSQFLMGQPGLPALGASGSIAGIIMVFSLLYPQTRILVMGLIPLPAIWGVIFLVGIDLWGLVSQMEGGGLPIGHGAHLGGAAAGLIYYFYIRRLGRR